MSSVARSWHYSMHRIPKNDSIGRALAYAQLQALLRHSIVFVIEIRADNPLFVRVRDAITRHFRSYTFNLRKEFLNCGFHSWIERNDSEHSWCEFCYWWFSDCGTWNEAIDLLYFWLKIYCHCFEIFYSWHGNGVEVTVFQDRCATSVILLPTTIGGKPNPAISWDS